MDETNPGRPDLDRLFQQLGFCEYRWIRAPEIVVASWVRMKCRFGCREYGRNASCPPNTPELAECRDFFSDYQRAAIFHFEKKVEKPEDRHEWTRRINQELLELERQVFLQNHPKVFLLAMDSCSLCPDCTGLRTSCRQARSARPTPEALGVDVFSTVRKAGYPITVLADYASTMNRYAFLLVD